MTLKRTTGHVLFTKCVTKLTPNKYYRMYEVFLKFHLNLFINTLFPYLCRYACVLMISDISYILHIDVSCFKLVVWIFFLFVLRHPLRTLHHCFRNLELLVVSLGVRTIP